MSCACLVSNRHDSESPTIKPFECLICLYLQLGCCTFGRRENFKNLMAPLLTRPNGWRMMIVMNSGIFLHSMLSGASTHWRDWGVPRPDNYLQVPTGQWGSIPTTIPISTLYILLLWSPNSSRPPPPSTLRAGEIRKAFSSFILEGRWSWVRPSASAGTL